MFEFTKRSRRILEILAQTEAKRLNSEIVRVEHIFIALLNDSESVACRIIRNLNVDIDDLRSVLEKSVLKSSTTVMYGRIPLDKGYKRVIELAREEAGKLKNSYIGTEHLLLAIIKEGTCKGLDFLKEQGVSYLPVRNEIYRVLGLKNSEDKNSKLKNNQKQPVLEDFALDLTIKAEKGELDPVIGRDDEIARVVRILCRKHKNNPILIGEAGVGKTAIVEGLAMQIHNKEVPELLHSAKVMSLDIASIVAGTKYRGEFEDRLKKLVQEIVSDKNIIVFIDEIHTIIGAGAAEGAIDAANILKPALARGELQCIGATTLNEYKMYVEKDAALVRRFQSVFVEEPDINETLEILKGLKDRYEEHHKVYYTEAALKKAVYLSDRYITDRFLPDKAIDIIDEAGAFARLASHAQPEDISELENEIDKLNDEKNAFVQNQEYEKAATLRDIIIENRQLLERKSESWKNRRDEYTVTVDAIEIAEIVAEGTGIPVYQLEESEAQKLLGIEDELREHIIGQDIAVDAVSRAIRRTRSGLGSRNKPSGTFIFLGPTGVGKTELAKTLATFLFHSDKNLIRFDMTEYMEKHAVSRLIGSPPGYVGFEEGGQLTERVKRRPYSVILFDEIEKAHPDIMNILLQVLDEGELTDGSGVTVSFRDCILIMTTNVGTKDINKLGRMGFSDNKSAGMDREDKIRNELKSLFNPEFLNRIDDIVVFNQLEGSHFTSIVGIMLDEVSENLSQQGITITFTPGVHKYLAEKGYNEEYGARFLRRIIQQEIEDTLAIELLSGNWSENPQIHAIIRGKKISFKSISGNVDTSTDDESMDKKNRETIKQT